MDNFISFCEAMRIKPSEEFFGALTYLMLALQAIVTSPGNLGDNGKKRAVTIMARTIYKLLSGQNFIYFTINVMGLSFCLAAVRKVTNSVWLCVICHFIVNAIPEAARYDSCSNKQVFIAPILIIVSIGCVMISKKVRLNKT